MLMNFYFKYYIISRQAYSLAITVLEVILEHKTDSWGYSEQIRGWK